MSSLSSPLNFRSVNSISSCNFDSCVYLVRNVQFRRNGSSFRKRWKYGGVCKHFVTAKYIAEQGTSISLDSAHRVIKDNADDSFIIPVSKSGSKVEPLLSMAWDETGRGGSSDDETTSDKDKERSRVVESLGEVLEKAEKLEISKQVRLRAVESLGEVLEKAEKLETSKQVSLSLSADKPPADERAYQKNVVPNKDKSVQSKSKTTKSIWRKGNPVSAVQRVFKEPRVDGEGVTGFKTVAPPLWRKGDPVAAVQKVSKEPRVDGEGGTGFKTAAPSLWRKGDPVAAVQKVFDEPRVDGEGATGFKTVAPFRPSQPPRRVEAKLPIGEPVIFKDVNAATESPVRSETDLGSSPKLRKPILIDRFSVKKPMVDPLIAKAVLAPSKPGKNPATSRFKGELRKKSDSSEGPRRRMVVDKGGIPDEDLSEYSAATTRKGRKWSKASRKAARLRAARDAAPVRMEIIEVSEDGMLTEELAYNLAISEGEILGYMFAKGIRPDGVQKISKDMVRMICKEYEVEVIDALAVRVEDMAKKKEVLDEDDLDKLEYRPPVLTIMGHVDHGKTTLLDYIRKTKVAAAEAGGITQGIGAYTVQVPIDGNTQTCVFLDTPGHEAFGAMRARGARVTDIAIIVVAADDGLQPQTNEAIAHAKAAGVPIVVAINKIDKDGANPDRVVQDLSSVGLMPEEWGGDIPMVKISALKGENVDELLETVILVAELQELKANPHRNAKGIAIEAGLDKSKGPVATFIVQNGTLRRGDIIVCGEAFGKVRALFDDNRKQVDKAGPSIPVQVLGLNNVPLAGDEFEVVSSHDVARERAESRAEYLRNEHITAKAGDGKVTLSSFASAVSRGNSAGLDLHQLNIILKVDVQGSLEAVRQALQVLPQDNITLKFLLQVTGDVSSSDVDLAVASKAIIFGFNAKAPGSVKKYADHKNVEVRLYKVIYELIDDVRKAMEGLLDHVEEQVPIGSAEVRAVFSSGSSLVAGCMVTEGKVVKDCGIRVLRKGKEVHVGVLSSLRRVKEMVKEVNAGLECGIGTEGFTDWEVGDTIEAFNTVQKKRTLEEASASMSAALEDVRIQL